MKIINWRKIRLKYKNCYDRAAINHTLRRREWVNLFKNKPCADCYGWYNPWQMHFDHLPGTDKKFNIGQQLNWRKASILKEMAKCELVCANCHADRTYKRKKNISPITN